MKPISVFIFSLAMTCTAFAAIRVMTMFIHSDTQGNKTRGIILFLLAGVVLWSCFYFINSKERII